MSLRDIDRRHLLLVGLYSTRNAIRGGAGLAFLVLVLFVGLVIADACITPYEKVHERVLADGGSEEDAQRQFAYVVSESKPVVSWFVGERDGVLLVEQPSSGDQDRDQDRQRQRNACFPRCPTRRQRAALRRRHYRH